METSISTPRIIVALLSLLMTVASAAASHATGADVFTSPGISTGLYGADSTVKFISDVLAPFLLLTIVLQRGLESALAVTTDEDSGKRRRRLVSLIMALSIVGMILPTKFFDMLNRVTATVFGYSFFAAIAVLGLIWLYFLWKVFSRS